MQFCQVVSTTVYLDDMADMKAFDEVYGKYFHGELPARTTVQQIVPAERSPDKDGHYPDLEQVSLIAVRHDCPR
jgi:enamine deaminase RidA (YjgF/YER057c/UK114 family)